MKKFTAVLWAVLLCLSLCACVGSEGGEIETPVPKAELQESISAAEIYTDSHEVGPVLPEEVRALAEAAPPIWTTLNTEASGVLTYENEEAIIDYSNTKDGYVMIKYLGETDQKLKARLYGPTTTYTYTLHQGQWETFPLSDGNGSYDVTVYCGTGGSRYATMLTVDIYVELEDEFAPFLRPNQYVDYMVAPNAIAKAEELVADVPETLAKVAVIYDYVVDNFVYDDYKAATVKSGYLPVLDVVLAEQKGICFDYASLMAGMLRSQGIPCKLIVGYAGSAYHAWISVWTEEFGWIDGAIYFDGTTWHRMDPTFASSAQRSDYVMDFIANDNNYSTKYLY